MDERCWCPESAGRSLWGSQDKTMLLYHIKSMKYQKYHPKQGCFTHTAPSSVHWGSGGSLWWNLGTCSPCPLRCVSCPDWLVLVWKVDCSGLLVTCQARRRLEVFLKQTYVSVTDTHLSLLTCCVLTLCHLTERPEDRDDIKNVTMATYESTSSSKIILCYKLKKNNLKTNISVKHL